MNSRRKYIVISAGILVLLFLAAGSYQGMRRYHFAKKNYESLNGKEHAYYIYPDTPRDSVFAWVRRDYKVLSEHAFARDLKRMPFEQPKPGFYRFPTEMGNRLLFHRLRNGEQTPVKISFLYTIRTNEQLAARLAKQLLTDSASIATLLNDDAYMAQYSMNKETARCLFMPDTYEVYWTITAEQLIARMEKEYKRFWNETRLKQAKAIGLTPQEVYTLASIVTSETTNAKEYSIIAGLYLNRMRIGMHLQACPTAVYASGNFNARRVTHAMTATNSPYNTYKNLGLPPGPIRVTQAEVIDSTLHATKSKYLYMCANPDFSGTHIFSESYAKHAAAGRQYHRELNKRKIRK